MRDVEALQHVAAQVSQHLQLVLGFNAFSHHFHLQCVGELNDRLDDGTSVGADRDVDDKAAINLQLPRRNVAQMGQRRIAGAEVIDGQANSQRGARLPERRKAT